MNKFIAAALVLLSMQLYAADKEKYVVGETAIIAIADNKHHSQNYLARIDTGAKISSIHAVDIKINGLVLQDKSKARQQIGKTVSFTSLNLKGGKQRLESIITDVLTVRNAQGVERRYVIELTFDWQGFEKTIAVNLRDRSAMKYKLLIGRNWLHNDIIVDVDKNEGIIN